MRKLGLILFAASLLLAGCSKSEGDGKIDAKLTEGTTNVNEAPSAAPATPAQGTQENP